VTNRSLAVFPVTMTLADAHWTEHLVRANGIRQHVWRTGGNKPAVVCLPGFSEIGLTWSRVARALQDRFDVIMPDFRGQGQTDTGDGYSQSILVADVAALLAELKVTKASVIGFSNGGGVATELAAEYRHLVRAVVLEDGGWFPKPTGTMMSESPQYRAWFDSYIAWLESFQRLSPEEQRSQIVTRMPIPAGMHWSRDDVEGWAASMAQYQIDFARGGMSLWSGSDTPVRDLIGSLRVPVLMLLAMQGGMPGMPKPIDEIRARAATMPNLTVLEFETSHFIRRDDFDRYIAAVSQFLESAQVAG